MKVLQMEESSFPELDSAFRLGQNNDKRALPRLLLSLWNSANRYLKQQDLEEVYLLLVLVSIFMDIPTGAIKIRCSLKAIRRRLQEAWIKYCWLPSGKLFVNYQGQCWAAGDEESDQELLEVLKLEDPPELSQRTYKWKLNYPNTPQKQHKIALRDKTRQTKGKVQVDYMYIKKILIFFFHFG